MHGIQANDEGTLHKVDFCHTSLTLGMIQVRYKAGRAVLLRFIPTNVLIYAEIMETLWID